MRRRGAEPILGGEDPEQVALARGHDEQVLARLKSALDVSRDERIFVLGLPDADGIERMGEPPMPDPGGQKCAVVPQGERRIALGEFDAHPARHALRGAAQ